MITLATTLRTHLPRTLETNRSTRGLGSLALGLLSLAPLVAQRNVEQLGHGLPGSSGVPRLATSAPRLGMPLHVSLSSARPNAAAYLVVGVQRLDLPLFGGTLVPRPDLVVPTATDHIGSATTELPIPSDQQHVGLRLYLQTLVQDPVAPAGLAFSGGVRCTLFQMVHSDFNGDDRCDLAIGVPGEDVEGLQDAGAVNVLYGGGNVLGTAGNQLWHQNTPGVLQMAESGDSMGTAVATGDFNGDGFADVAIGAPGENIGQIADAGAVHVLYGSTGGLTASGDQVWDQNSPGILGAAEGNDRFGQSLATGDFNGDGYADLAIGVPGESINGQATAGAINILLGTPVGLTAAGNQLFHQDSPGILGVAESGDRFGWSLAVGNFNDDSRDDLAIGAPTEAIGGNAAAGAVHVLLGSAVGLHQSGNQFFHQDSPGILGQIQANDRFGTALAAADFNGDGRDDLAVGVPFERVSGFLLAGAVNILRGSPVGLHQTGNQYWHQNSSGMHGVAGSGDLFGHALAAADFNNDGFADLAIGIPGDDVQTSGPLVPRAGTVNVLRGASGGLSADLQRWRQGYGAIKGTPETDDGFGAALGIGDFNNDGRMDLAIGIPGEGSGAGAVSVLRGSFASSNASVLSPIQNQLWSQDSSGILDVSEAGDRFGAALSR